MKTAKIALATVILTLAPGLALAECSYGLHQQAQSCAQGSSWDAQAGACVADATTS